MWQNFSIHPRTPTNFRPESGLSTPLFASDWSYGFSEFCNFYKDKHESSSLGLAKSELESESAPVKKIETIQIAETGVPLKNS